MQCTRMDNAVGFVLLLLLIRKGFWAGKCWMGAVRIPVILPFSLVEKGPGDEGRSGKRVDSRLDANGPPASSRHSCSIVNSVRRPMPAGCRRSFFKILKERGG